MAMVDAMDEAIGQVVKAVEKNGMKENTLIVFCSDNGGVKNVADNSPHRGSKLTVYQGGINVVAAARWPNGNISGGKIIRERMGYIDVLPTILEVAAGKNIPGNLDGISVLKALRGEKLKDRSWFTYLDQNPEKIERFALNTDVWKLVWERNAPDNPKQFEQIELFRIDDDKVEFVNLKAGHNDIVQKLQKETICHKKKLR